MTDNSCCECGRPLFSVNPDCKFPGNHKSTKAKPLHPAEALSILIAAARTYTASREACPVGDWKDRYEKAGWDLAQATRAYDKASIQTP